MTAPGVFGQVSETHRPMQEQRVTGMILSVAGTTGGVGTPESLGGSPMLTRIRTTLRREEGASAVEYGILVAAIAAVIVAVVFILGTKVKAAFQTTCSSMTNVSGSC